MRHPFLTPGLLVIFVLGAIVWYVWTSPAENPHVTQSATLSSAAGGTASAGRMPFSSSARATSGSRSFLSSHETDAIVVPSGENVAATFHVEMEVLKGRLEIAPDDTTALIRMARLKHDAHQLEEAVDVYLRYLAVNPKGRQARLDLTQAYGALEQWDNALTLTKETLNIFPEDPAALYNLGAIHANQGRIAEARSAWQTVSNQTNDLDMQKRATDALKRIETLKK